MVSKSTILGPPRVLFLRTQDLANRTAAADIIHRFHTPFRQLILDLEGAQTAATSTSDIATAAANPDGPATASTAAAATDNVSNFAVVTGVSV
jgi:hypothetical protein